MTQLTENYLERVHEKNTKGDKRSRKAAVLQGYCRVLEMITCRFRLIDSAWESEVLAKVILILSLESLLFYLNFPFQVYQQQAAELGYESFHLYLRSIQFGTGKFKDGADSAKPIWPIAQVQEDDTLVDKYAFINFNSLKNINIVLIRNKLTVISFLILFVSNLQPQGQEF